MAGHRDPNLQGTVVVAGGMNTDVVDRSFAPQDRDCLSDR